MGFPEAIAQAQRQEVTNHLVRIRDELGEIVDMMRAGAPHHIGVGRENYDIGLAAVRSARTQTQRAIDFLMP